MLHYVFKSSAINKFKFCPYCGGEIMQVYDGDYMGMVQCFDCDECDEELQYDILEERLARHPKWIVQFKGEKQLDKNKLIEFVNMYYQDISHPLAVANSFPEMSQEWIVGLFHDIFEDYEGDKRNLQHRFIEAIGYDWEIYRAIEWITRISGEHYFDYIESINRMMETNREGGLLAWKVKIADLKHNLSRVDTLKPSLKERYEKALVILERREINEIH